MVDHTHTWEPAPNQIQRYVCACGATGFRKGVAIVPHKQKRDYSSAPETHVGLSNMPGGNAHRGKSGPGGW